MNRFFTLASLLAVGSLLPGFSQTKAPCFKVSGYKVGSLAPSVAVGDINGDGRPDFVTAPGVAKAPNTYAISMLLAQSGGGYALSEYPIDSYSQSVAVADLDGNGRADILLASMLGGGVTVLRSQSDGSFARSDYKTASTPSMVITKDVNGDGKPDIITANPSTVGSSVSVFLSQSDGTYVRDDYSTGAGRDSRWVAVGDVNGDKLPDLVTANPNNSTVSILLGQSAGKFGSPTDYAIGGSVFGVAVGDLNKDGRADIVVDKVNDNAVAVLLTKADGTFDRADYPTGNAPWEVQVGDVNGDGQLDIVTADHNEITVSILLGLPDGTFIPKIDQQVSAYGAPYSVAITNVNGDSYTDLVTADFGTPGVSVLLGQPVPDITLTVGGKLSCYTPGVALSAVGAPSGTSYSFSGPGVSDVSGSTATARQLGTYAVTVNSGECPVIATATVEGNLTPPQDVKLEKTSTALTCLNSTAKLTASSSTSGVRYAFSGPLVSGIDNTTASAGKGGQYTVTVTRSDNGCQAQATTTVDENKTPPQDVKLEKTSLLTCVNTSVNLTASTASTEPVTYVFSGAGLRNVSGNTAQGTQPVPYQVVVTRTDNGCSAQATTTVTQNVDPPQNVKLDNNGQFTANTTTVTLTASSLPGVSYQFSPGATQQNGGNTATVTTSGSYSVTVTRSDNGCQAQASTTVYGASSLTVCRGATALINLTAAGSPIRYEWYLNAPLGFPFRDGAFYSGATTASLSIINVQQSGAYYAKVYYADGSSVAYGPYRVTINYYCSGRLAAVSEAGTELRITLLGNPLTGDALRAVIEGAAHQRLQVDLLDVSGRPLRSQVFEAAESAQALEWNLSSAGSGLYLLQARSGTQQQSTKLVKP